MTKPDVVAKTVNRHILITKLLWLWFNGDAFLKVSKIHRRSEINSKATVVILAVTVSRQCVGSIRRFNCRKHVPDIGLYLTTRCTTSLSSIHADFVGAGVIE